MKKNHSTKNKLCFLFIIVFVGLLFTVKSAHALTLSPTRIEIAGDPGQTLSEKLTLINENKTAETYYSSFANFEAQGESGNPTFVQPKDDLGTWMSVAPSVTLQAGESQVIPFTVTIPKSAEPGGHFATIFWGTGQDKPGTVAIGAKTGILVLLSVSGDVKESAGFLNFNTINKQFWYSTLPVSFEYRFKNAGGDKIKPDGEIHIRDTVFLPADTLDANISKGNILPGSTRRFQVDWIKYTPPDDATLPAGFFKTFWNNVSYQWKNFAVGLYSAHLHLTYGSKGEQATSTAYFFVFPWQLLLVMLITIIIVVFGGGMILRSYNRFIIRKAQHTAQ